MTRRKKKRFSIFRILVLLLLVVLIVLVLVLIFKNGINLDKTEEETKVEDIKNKSINEVVEISCNDYDVYFDEDNKLGFNFIIAELNFVNKDGSLYYDLKNIYTGEKIKLNEVDYYTSKLKEFNYDINKFNLLSNEFTSEGGSLTGEVFIPFLKSYNALSIYNGEKIDFDLTKNKHSINELLYEIKTEDIKTDKYDIHVSNPYPETEFVTDTGEACSYPYVLIFEISVKEITANNVYIKDAKFIPDGALSGFTLTAIDDHVNSYKIENAINKKLKTGDKYGLLFQASEQTVTTGIITIQLSDSDNWIELKVGE